MSTDALMNTYGERALTLVKGESAWLWDDQGNRYLDGVAGVAVCILGHAHPAVTKALSQQAATLVHTSNLYNLPPQQKLAEKLRELSGMTNAFFSNSGAEANEAAIKLARLYGRTKNIDVPTIAVMQGAFHGRTLATLTASGNRKIQAGYDPLVRGFVRAPFDDIAALENIAANNSSVVAVMVEPIQGEGGIRVPDADYLRKLRELCDRNDWLLILDEIQTGNGRTGKFFAYQHAKILPDIVTTAKGLANGVPIGACLASGVAATLMQPGSHGSTFGGNPLACSAALATLETLLADNLMERATQLGTDLLTRFQNALADRDNVVEIRGYGMMFGIELNQPCPEIVAKAVANGVLVNVTSGSTIRLLPPLNLTDEQADLLVERVVKTVTEYAPS